MFKPWMIGALLALCGAMAFAETHSPTAIKAFNAGVEFANNGDYQNALGHFDDAIAADSDFAEAYYVRAVCRYSLKMTEGAQSDLNEAIRRKPDLYDAYALRGTLAYETEQYDQAYDDVTIVLQHKPDDAQAMLVRAVIELKREDVPSAKRDFKAFVKLRPDDPMTPKVRELLGQMEHVATVEADTEASAPKQKSSAAAPARHASRPSNAAPTPTLSARALAEKFGHQLLQGDRGPITGDINQRAAVQAPQ